MRTKNQRCFATHGEMLPHDIPSLDEQTMSNPYQNHGLNMGTHGLSMDRTWFVLLPMLGPWLPARPMAANGPPMGHPWSAHGWTMVTAWVKHGLVFSAWTMQGPCRDHGPSMGAPWVVHGQPWCFAGVFGVNDEVLGLTSLWQV